MRYFSYNEPTEDGNIVVTVSEDEIRKNYWPYWVGKLKELGRWKDSYTFEDCLEHWCITHWAWESSE
jgi:hypothetical protein